MRVTIGYIGLGQWGAVDDSGKILFSSEPDIADLSMFVHEVVQCMFGDSEYGVTEVVVSDQAHIAELLDLPITIDSIQIGLKNFCNSVDLPPIKPWKKAA